MLEAIRALQYEGTKSEVVRNFKDQGNEMVKAKKWTDAKEFYSKGIAVLIDTSNKYEKSDDIKAEQWEQRLLEEVLYANRAQCNLELSELVASFVGTANVYRKLSGHHSRLCCGSKDQPEEHQSSLPFGPSTTRS